MYVRPDGTGSTVRDYAFVVRLGRAGARRVGAGVQRIETEAEGIRAFRIRSRTGDAIVAANFSEASASLEIGGQAVTIPAMDSLVIEV